MTTETLRRGLRNIQTRSTTIDAAVNRGDTAVDCVVPLLQDRNEGVRWSAIRILAEIGDERAVGALIALLDQSKNATDAVNALRTITGEDFGEDAAEWRRWAARDPEIRNAAAGPMLSDEELVERATRELPVTVTGRTPAYVADVSLPDGRSQRVWIDFSRTDPQDRPLVQLCTPCGKADSGQYETALTLNMSIPFGALALATLDDTLCFAVVDAYLREIVHPEDIAESLMSLAANGDSVEASLSKDDRF